MCGVAGIVGQWDGVDLTSFRDSALEILAQRGPDGSGATALVGEEFVDVRLGAVPRESRVLLLHRRLSVIDPSNAGAQPMVSRDRSAAITYNGEIYNSTDISDALPGFPWRGHSDTEPLLQWLVEGRGLAALKGMFAFACVDVRRGRVQLVRDEYGIKPLFIARRGDALAFASDVRVLLQLPGVRRRVGVGRVAEYLVGGTSVSTAGSTAFDDIEAVLPGQRIECGLDGGSVKREQWVAVESAGQYTGTFKQAVAELRELFRQSVREHLRSDVRIGCALSGGIDSSSIICVARDLFGQDLELHAVSHIADTRALSEESWIDEVAQATKCIVHKVRPRATDLAHDIDDLILTQGEPVGSTSIYAQYRVFRQAREVGLTVMLDGQGADELVAGYSHLRAPWVRECLRTGDLQRAYEVLCGSHAVGRSRAADILLLLARDATAGRLRHLMGALVGRPQRPSWLRMSAAEAVALTDAMRDARQSSLRASLELSLFSSLQALLRYEDRNSMRFSIESRVPFLDRDVARFLRSLPSTFLFGPDGQSKFVLREAMRGIVPDSVLNRRDKIGFENHEGEWLKQVLPWAHEVIENCAPNDELIDPRALRAAVSAIADGKGLRQARRVWATLLTVRWRQLMRLEVA